MSPRRLREIAATAFRDSSRKIDLMLSRVSMQQSADFVRDSPMDRQRVFNDPRNLAIVLLGEIGQHSVTWFGKNNAGGDARTELDTEQSVRVGAHIRVGLRLER
jgi:hypothetical protein